MPSLPGKVLLGWMPQRTAIRALQTQCVWPSPPPESFLVQLWEKYRSRVEKLKPISPLAPEYPLTEAEKEAAEKFLDQAHSAGAANVEGVAKVDAGQLVLRQEHIVLPQAEKYGPLLKDESTRISTLLALGESPRAKEVGRAGSIVIFELPHAEFGADFSSDGVPRLFQHRQFVSITELKNRLLLWSGVHRAFEILRQTATGTGDGRLLAVKVNHAQAGIEKDPERLEMVLGARPPLLSDLLNPDLALDVQFIELRFFMTFDLQSKECRLQRVRAGAVPLV